MQKRIQQIISEVLTLEMEQVSGLPLSAYRTPGWDSLATVEIVEKVEEEFNIEISDVEMVQCISFEGIEAIISEKVSK